MIKIYTNANGALFKVTCLSTDDKPIGVVPANTICEELDTGKKFFYNPAAKQWTSYPGGSSGGNVPDPETADIGKVLGIVADGTGAKYAPVEGGGSGDFIVNLETSGQGVTSDKTFTEIMTAFVEGKNIVGILNYMRYAFNAIGPQFELYLTVDEVISVNILTYISDSGNKWMPGGIELDMTPFEVGVLIDPQTGAISVTKSNASIYDAWMKGKSVWLNVPGIDARMLLEKAPTEDFAMFSHTYSDLDPSQDTMKRIEGYIRTTNGVQTCTVRALTWNATQFNPLGGSEA